ncbi:13887_t:CDS:2 [Acaulospora colombiana]|uniref:13887_t:CDS:1 n=1 Tax=Acaulospora colombiana TaxID=27376 RepID=A0ACA9NT63_9GLOM|nr:13887_t:CDS:2 [Acaulospora colombiana]
MSTTSNETSFTVLAGYKGFMNGTVNAANNQRATLTIKRSDGQTESMATFEGSGVRKNMANVQNRVEYWSFGPYSGQRTATIKIEYETSGSFKPSKTVILPQPTNGLNSIKQAKYSKHRLPSVSTTSRTVSVAVHRIPPLLGLPERSVASPAIGLPNHEQ